jgi:uncharacterized repeat protein (TIGR02543 family)
VVPTANTTCTASFTPVIYTVTPAKNLPAGGTVTATDANSDGTWDLVATPNAGYTFAGWSCSASQTPASASSATTTVVPTANTTCTASFTPVIYTVTPASDLPAGGTVTATDANSDRTWDLVATPNAGYTFAGWSCTASQTPASTSSATTTVVPTANTTCTASFTPVVVPTPTPVPSIVSHTLAFDIFYNLNSATLDSKNKAIIKAKYQELRSKLSPNAKVVVKVIGWVQPTKISPNVRGLSIWRAKSVVQYMKSLGLDAKYIIQAPGHEKLNIAQSRRASAVISWSTTK